MDEIERTPLVWFRCIDDIFFIWTHGKEHLETFLQELSFWFEIYFRVKRNKISFLDLKVKLKEGKISTDLYIERTDRHQYLNFTSSHPNHTNRLVVDSHGLRVKRICSEKADFLKHMSEMNLWLLKRGCPENVVDQELGKVKFSKSPRRTNKRDKGVCLVFTYHPLLQNIGRLFRRLLNLLYTGQEVERVFTPGPMAWFLSARKICSYLVRAKLCPLERHVSSFRCGGRFYLNVMETETAAIASTNQIYKINHEFNFTESFLIYLLTCRKQYGWRTVDIFRSR